MVQLLFRCLEENPEDAGQATVLAEKLGALRSAELVRLVRSMCTVRSTLSPQQRDVLKHCEF